MEKMKEDNEAVVHSLKSQIAELNAEILEKDNRIDVIFLYQYLLYIFGLHWP